MSFNKIFAFFFFREDARKSSREISSIARASEEDTASASFSVRNDAKIDTMRKNL